MHFKTLSKTLTRMIIFPQLSIIQALLQPLNELFQNTKKVTKCIVIKLLCFYTISMSSNIGRSQVLERFLQV